MNSNFGIVDPCAESRLFTSRVLSEIEKHDRLIALKQKEIEELGRMKSELANLPKKLRHEIMVPIGSIGYVPGEITNTNQFFVFLGENYFVERTAYQTVEIIDRRIRAFDEFIQKLENQKASFQRTLELSNSIFSESEGQVEIREPCIEIRQDTKIRHEHPKKYESGQIRPKQVSDEEFKALMNRLDELEMLEERESESYPEIIVSRRSKTAMSQHKSQVLEKTLMSLNICSRDAEKIDSDDDASMPDAKLDRRVSFAKKIDSDITVQKDLKDPTSPKSILKNKTPTPIDHQLVQEMDRRGLKTIMPMNKDVFNGIIKEKTMEASTFIEPLTPPITKPKLSKFKADRKKL